MQNYLKILLMVSCFRAFALEQEAINSLAQKTQWLKLLHYDSNTSRIINSDFFLSPDGQLNPLGELQATIQGLKESPALSCRFPARRLWLEQQGMQFAPFTCPEWEQWTRGKTVRSVSVIFADGFLGNPASFFGHPLLKINFMGAESPLMETAINYGAFTPQDVNPAEYAIFGIFGGYQAGFTTAEFYFHRSNYAELELRDMWEYELKLSSSERDLLVAHLFEMMSARLKYYFFGDNCAYRMSYALELATGKKLQAIIPVAIPISLFHRLSEESLISKPQRWKSRQTRLRENYLGLSAEERDLVKQLAVDTNTMQKAPFLSLGEGKRAHIIEVALDYEAFMLAQDNTSERIQRKKQLLRARAALPAGRGKSREMNKRPPHESQKPILTGMGFTKSEKWGDGGSLRVRPVFYDLISPDAGRPALSSLSVFDLEADYFQSEFRIKKFDAISIENLNRSITGLPGDGGWAWRLRVGADQLNLACRDCLAARAEAGLGQAIELHSEFVFWAMLDPRLQSSVDGSGHLSLRPHASVLITLSNDVRMLASLGRRYYLDRNLPSETMSNIEMRLGSNKSWDIRMGYEVHLDHRASLMLNFYQ
ncbi:MAG: DUF4105 domain-containing protein [Bacteriovoracia bacterium]